MKRRIKIMRVLEGNVRQFRGFVKDLETRAKLKLHFSKEGENLRKDAIEMDIRSWCIVDPYEKNSPIAVEFWGDDDNESPTLAYIELSNEELEMDIHDWVDYFLDVHKDPWYNDPEIRRRQDELFDKKLEKIRSQSNV